MLNTRSTSRLFATSNGLGNIASQNSRSRGINQASSGWRGSPVEFNHQVEFNSFGGVQARMQIQTVDNEYRVSHAHVLIKSRRV
jgi:hypothetical protein